MVPKHQPDHFSPHIFQGGRATTNLDNKNQGTGWCFVGFPAIFSTRPGQRLQKTMGISIMLSMGKSTITYHKLHKLLPGQGHGFPQQAAGSPVGKQRIKLVPVPAMGFGGNWRLVFTNPGWVSRMIFFRRKNLEKTS